MSPKAIWPGSTGHSSIVWQFSMLPVLEKYPLLDAEPYKGDDRGTEWPSGNMIFKAQIWRWIFRNRWRWRIQKLFEKQTLFPTPVSTIFAERKDDAFRAVDRCQKDCRLRTCFPCLRSAELQLILAESYYH